MGMGAAAFWSLSNEIKQNEQRLTKLIEQQAQATTHTERFETETVQEQEIVIPIAVPEVSEVSSQTAVIIDTPALPPQLPPFRFQQVTPPPLLSGEGRYITSLVVDEPSEYDFTLATETTDNDNQLFQLIEGHIIGQNNTAENEQTVFILEFEATNERGDIVSFPLAVSLGVAPQELGRYWLQEGDPAAAYQSALSPVFSPEVQYWAPHILAWAKEYSLDPDIIATIMQIESCGDPEALSSAGAQGLFQVMPHHFDDGENMIDPDTNAFRGMSYYNLGLEIHSGNLFRAFAGYNAGHGAAKRDQTLWPNETQRYYYWSTGIYNDAKAGLEESPRLEEWFLAYGVNLCDQAAGRLGIRSE